MFHAFRQFVSEFTGGDKHPSRFEENDYRLAAAALLVHAAAIDGNVSDVERKTLHTVIKQRFNLDDATTDELLAEATTAENEAIDLYHFTSLLNRSLDEEGRRRIVEMMWENRLRGPPCRRVRGQSLVARGRPARRLVARADRAPPARRRSSRR